MISNTKRNEPQKSAHSDLGSTKTIKNTEGSAKSMLAKIGPYKLPLVSKPFRSLLKKIFKKETKKSDREHGVRISKRITGKGEDAQSVGNFGNENKRTIPHAHAEMNASAFANLDVEKFAPFVGDKSPSQTQNFNDP